METLHHLSRLARLRRLLLDEDGDAKLVETDGREVPTDSDARFDQREYVLRDRLAKRVVVRDGDARSVYRCDTLAEYKRAHRSMVQEPGTLAWLRGELREGDVYYDVGANIGVYVLLAGRRVGPAGAVYAWEPHMANAAALLRNVAENDLQDRVSVLSCALADRPGFFDFHYGGWAAGTAMSQLGTTRDANERELAPVATELKYATTVDDLRDAGVIRAPTLVKVDVDGNELQVLRGMRGLLTGPDRPRALQVEVNRRAGDELRALLADCDFELCERHRSHGAQVSEDASFNAIFRPSTSSMSASSDEGSAAKATLSSD